MQHAVQIAAAVSQIVAVRKLAQIKRQVLPADVMELADQRAFHQGPEALDCVGVRRAELPGKHIPIDVSDAMIDDAVRHDVVEPAVAGIFARRQDSVRQVNGLAGERLRVILKRTIP